MSRSRPARAGRSVATLTALALTATLLGGCAGTVKLPAAENANDPACADIGVRYPAAVAGQDRRWTDAQSTAAWGSPTAVIVTCGVAVPGPTTLPCQTFDGVDWVIDDSQAPRYLATTFNRTPAVQIYLDGDTVPASDVMSTLSAIVSRLPANDAQCTNRVDG
ncbi:DUF3515 family protein [uncultured Microbacterium sp.]|jgi:Protein of unknown function (DUF3515)|uniref:DUF3515 family protein n=1 Tax=uncultured Microbacterium sp. TaxID=191216 RepID=UPI0025F6AC20|nr:DUF3515 family protein [uncultured Microbacterium sp.]